MARHSASKRQMGARGWRVSGYAADELAGAGGSGEVWRGHDVRTGEAVALKRLAAGDDAARAALRGEAEALAQLDHPHIVRLRAVVETGSETVLVLDYLPGPSLADLLRRRGRLRPGEVVAALAPIAGAVAHAHSRGVVHGDVTPANIVMGSRGQPVLADLGVARRHGAADRPVAATPHYTDPLVAAGSMPTPSSDVFAVAAAAFHALAGVPPWGGATAADVFDVAAEAELPDLDVLAPEASPPLRALIRRGLSPDPSRRGDAEELARELWQAHPPERVDLAGRGAGSAPRRLAPTHLVPRRDGPPSLAERLGRSSAELAAPAAEGRWWSRWQVGWARWAAGLGRAVRGVRPRRAASVVVAAIAAVLMIRLGIAWASPTAPATTGGAATPAVPSAGRTSAAPDPPTGPALTPAPSPASSPAPAPTRAETSDPPRPASPAGPRPSSSRGVVPASDPAADRASDKASVWADVLRRLDRARSAAFAAADPARLARVYTPQCPAIADDTARIARLAAAGESVDRVVHAIGPAAVVDADPARVVVDVVESLRAYRLAADDGVRMVPAGDPVSYRVVLARTGEEWRIESMARR